MAIGIDALTNRKLILVRQLYQYAEKSGELEHSSINRIMAVIGFDLAIETLLRVVVGALDDQKVPAKDFDGLIQQCEHLLSKKKLGDLPLRNGIGRVHDIRNDAQHKAKYPNKSDVSDCRTYTRDFCTEMVSKVWEIAFERLSQVELIDDEMLRKLLEVSLAEIDGGNLRKAVTLAYRAFVWASGAILESLPIGVVPLPDDELAIKRQLWRRSTVVLNYTEGAEALFYAAMLVSGVGLADLKRIHDLAPLTAFAVESDEGEEGSTVVARVHWGEKMPSEEDSRWMYDIIVSTIVNWQIQGLEPHVGSEWAREVETLIEWGSDVVVE